MRKKGYTLEQIIHKLGEAEILLNEGVGIAVMIKRSGVSDVTYYPLERRVWWHAHRSDPRAHGRTKASDANTVDQWLL